VHFDWIIVSLPKIDSCSWMWTEGVHMDGQVKSMKGNVKWVLILGVKRLSLSLSLSLSFSAENECRCEDSCVCTVLLHGIGCFPSFLKPVLCTVLIEKGQATHCKKIYSTIFFSSECQWELMFTMQALEAKTTAILRKQTHVLLV